MISRYVIDTVGLINYNNLYFKEKNLLSNDARRLIGNCFDTNNYNYKLIIPSVVFIEIHNKFLKTEEATRRFYYEIYFELKNSDNVEIKPIEQEILELVLKISPVHALDLHDKLIYASAAQLQCPLITNDPKIISANKKEKLVEHIMF